MKKLNPRPKFGYTVPDYEHSGDSEHELSLIKKICPIYDVNITEEEDYECDDYDEDEPTYQGYITFTANSKYEKELLDFGCYKI